MSVKKNDCDVVRDLIPLVLDRAACDGSRQLVQAHLTVCPDCKKIYDEMRAAMPAEARTAYEEENRTFMEALRAARRQKRRRRLTAALLAAVLCVVAAFGGMYAYDALYNRMSVTVDNSLYTLSLSRLQDGRIVVTAREDSLGFDHMSVSETVVQDGNRNLYLRFATTPVHHKSSMPQDNAGWNAFLLEAKDLDNLHEIRQGTWDQFVTIWAQGDDIPAASAQMEAFFALTDESKAMWAENIMEGDDGKATLPAGVREAYWQLTERIDAVRRTVPEWR